MIVGTNSMSTRRTVTSTEAIAFAQSHSALYWEFDAKSSRQRDAGDLLDRFTHEMIAAHKANQSLLLEQDGSNKPSVFKPVADSFKSFARKYFSCSA